MSDNLAKIVVVCGPTASGKSGLALWAAQTLGGAIINADSVQIYKGLDIGAAKPSETERGLVPHYLFDVAAPDEEFDAARYVELADAAIAEVRAKGLVPIVVGGTGLYIKALLYGLCDAPEIPAEIREHYRNLHVQYGAAHLHDLLQQRDPEMAARLHANDYVRVIRALEVWDATGESLLAWQKRHGGFSAPRYHALQIGVNLERHVLYERIDRRVDDMLAQGLETEVRGLLSQGYTQDLKALGSIGYRQMAAYINNEIDYAEMERLIKRDTRHYAKRQLTWFLPNKDIVWLDPAEKARFLDLVSQF